MRYQYPSLGLVLLFFASSKSLSFTRTCRTTWHTLYNTAGSSSSSSNSFESNWKLAELPIDTTVIGLGYFDKDGGDKIRGLKTKTGFKENTLLVQIKPNPNCIYVSETKDTKGCINGLETIWPSLSGNTRLSLVLLQKWESLFLRGSSGNTFVDAYLASLPKPDDFKTPIHWDDNLLQSFPYDHLKVSVMTQRTQWKNLYEKIKSFDTFQDISYERFTWALEIVRSRAFSGIGGIQYSIEKQVASFLFSLFSLSVWFYMFGVRDGDPYSLESLFILLITALVGVVPNILSNRSSSTVLIPVIDSCNHNSNSPSCIIQYNPSRSALELSSVSKAEPGEEITISYGNRNNDYLMQYFGFMESKNEHDRYTIVDPGKSLEHAIQNLAEDNIGYDTKTKLLQIAIDLQRKNPTTNEFIFCSPDDSTSVLKSWRAYLTTSMTLSNLTSELQDKAFSLLINNEALRIKSFLSQICDESKSNSSKYGAEDAEKFLKNKLQLLTIYTNK